MAAVRTFLSAPAFRKWLEKYDATEKEILIRCYKTNAGRRERSKWSRVNIRRAQELEAEGGMHPAGRAASAAKDLGSDRRYSLEEEPYQLTPEFEKSFRADRRAWQFFRLQAPWYQRTSIFWVMEARREETRARRLDHLIVSCHSKVPIKPLNRARVRTD